MVSYIMYDNTINIHISPGYGHYHASNDYNMLALNLYKSITVHDNNGNSSLGPHEFINHPQL